MNSFHLSRHEANVHTSFDTPNHDTLNRQARSHAARQLPVEFLEDPRLSMDVPEEALTGVFLVAIYMSL